MYKILRIICCVICALLVAACVFVFVYLGVVWGISTIVAAVTFFALTLLFKNLQEDRDKKKDLQQPSSEKKNDSENTD